MCRSIGWPYYVAWFYVNTTCVGVSLTTHAFIGFTSWYRITRNQEKFKKLYNARNLCLMIAFTWVFNFPSLCLIARLNEEKNRLCHSFLGLRAFCNCCYCVPKTTEIHCTPSGKDEANEESRRKDTEWNTHGPHMPQWKQSYQTRWFGH